MADPANKTAAKLQWRPNLFGNPDRALYFGDIYIGEVHSMAPNKEAWRAWLMLSDSGKAVGRAPTAAAARLIVEAKARKALQL